MAASSVLEPQQLSFKTGADIDVLFGATQNTVTLSGLSGANVRVTGVQDPSGATDAATKSYVDNFVQGLGVREAVRAASTVNVTLATDVDNGKTLDGVVLATNDRILIKDQSTATENGVYIVASSGAPTRATDLAAGADASGAYYFVDQGTVNLDKAFVCISNSGSALVGTDTLAFTLFTARPSVYAGRGLIADPTGELHVYVDSNVFEISDDKISLLYGGISNTKIAAFVDNTNSTNATSGALTTVGGIGVGQNIYAGGDITTLSTTASSSTTTGSLRAAGGLGVEGAAYIGSDVHANSFFTDSDMRLKKDVEPITDGLKTVTNMEAVTFTWRKTGAPSCGFIAQQIQEVAPLLVDASDPSLLRVEYTRAIPYLVQAVAELDKKLEVLKRQSDDACCTCAKRVKLDASSTPHDPKTAHEV